MSAGLIPKGDIDDRDIRDVKPIDISGYDHCHFFAGLGGWAYAYEQQKYREQSVWTGSCPCQPFSSAGKGDGFNDERDLWPYWFHLITQCLPTTIFGEQVSGKKGLSWFKRLQSDVDSLGRASVALDLPAGGFGATHKRNRTYWVAEDTPNTNWDEQSWEEPCSGSAGRMGGFKQPFPWDTSWQSALCRLRTVDDGLSYGVASTDATRNAICPQVASAFIETYYEARK